MVYTQTDGNGGVTQTLAQLALAYRIYKPYVNTYIDILTTYQNPQIGYTVEAIDTNIVYRWDGSYWVPVEKRDSSSTIYVGNTAPTDITALWIETTNTNTTTSIYPSRTTPPNTSLVWLDIN
jgi:hypothetical protein